MEVEVEERVWKRPGISHESILPVVGGAISHTGAWVSEGVGRETGTTF